MTITVRRRGGFAGIDERLASVDLGTLPGAVAQQLRDGVARLDALIAGGQPSVGAGAYPGHFGFAASFQIGCQRSSKTHVQR